MYQLTPVISYLERFIDPQKSQTLQYFAKELGVRCIDSDYPLYLGKLDEPVTIECFNCRFYDAVIMHRFKEQYY